MVDLNAIQQGVQIVKNEQGDSVVQVPLELWEAILKKIQPRQSDEIPQHEKFRALLAAWDAEPDDTPDEWWDDFETFLKANRQHFSTPDLKLGDDK